MKGLQNRYGFDIPLVYRGSFETGLLYNKNDKKNR